MRDYIDLGPTPVCEDCEQVGTANYDPIRARNECSEFRAQLIRMFGEPPGSARLKIASNPHDFGVYYEVRCAFEEDHEQELQYAYKLEGNLPEEWDEIARKQLGLKEEEI